MLNRRDFLILGLSCFGPLFFPSGEANSTGFPCSACSKELERIWRVLLKTVSPDIKIHQLGQFEEHVRNKLGWLLGEEVSAVVFEREICTHFILSSNLPSNNYSVNEYEFIDREGFCNPYARFL